MVPRVRHGVVVAGSSGASYARRFSSPARLGGGAAGRRLEGAESGAVLGSGCRGGRCKGSSYRASRGWRGFGVLCIRGKRSLIFRYSLGSAAFLANQEAALGEVGMGRVREAVPENDAGLPAFAYYPKCFYGVKTGLWRV